MGLFSPAWQTDNTKKLDKAVAAVQKINDQRQLNEIATTAPLYDVRIAAIRKMTDQAALAQIFEKADQFHLANITLERMTDQACLKQVALNGCEHCDGDLVEKIRDPAALVEIATRSKSQRIRLRAIDRIEDADALLTLMMDAPDSRERECARDTLDSNFINKHRRNESLSLTEAQFSRYIDALIAETEDKYTIYLPEQTSEEDLKRIYQEARRDSLREKAFLQLAYKAPDEQLLELYREMRDAGSKQSAEGGKPRFGWSDAEKYICSRLDRLGADDAPVLLAFVRDEDVNCNITFQCIRKLFTPEMDAAEDVDALRDEAVAAAIANIPAYIEKQGHDEEYCIWHLGVSIPPEARARYGFQSRSQAMSLEDAFGSFNADYEEIVYNGKTYTP